MVRRNPFYHEMFDNPHLSKIASLMITPQEFTAKWVWSPLIRLSKTSTDVLLPDISKTFLMDAGLPATGFLSISFSNLSEGLSSLWLIANKQTKMDLRLGNLYVIGAAQNEMYMCLASDYAWSIMAVPIECDRLLFVNSTIPQLAESILAFKLYELSLGDKPTWSIVHRQLRLLRKRLQVIDPKAMRPDCYWPQLLFALSV
jgi:hypothetical protein